jgi:hypothetical protein
MPGEREWLGLPSSSAKGSAVSTQSRSAASDPTPFRSYRSQLTLALITLGLFSVGLVMSIVVGVWEAAALVAVFVAGWIARVLMILRINRLGGYTDPRPDVRVHYRPVLRTQLIGWILVSLYFMIAGFWWGLLTTVPLGLLSLLLLRRVLPKG